MLPHSHLVLGQDNEVLPCSDLKLRPRQWKRCYPVLTSYWDQDNEVLPCSDLKLRLRQWGVTMLLSGFSPEKWQSFWTVLISFLDNTLRLRTSWVCLLKHYHHTRVLRNSSFIPNSNLSGIMPECWQGCSSFISNINLSGTMPEVKASCLS